MYRILVICLLLLLGSHSVQAAEPVLRIGIDAPYPPFAFIDEKTGKLTGFDYDIAVAFCKRIQRTCDIQIVPFDDLISSIAAGKLDIAVAGIGRMPEREKHVIFTDKYYRSTSIFVEREGNSVIERKALEGKRIGVQNATLQERYLRKNYDLSEIVEFKSFGDVTDALLARKIDIAFLDGLVAYHFLKSDEGQKLDIAGDPVMLGDDSFIVLHPSLVKEKEAINKAIADMRGDGEYDVINRKYFDFNIY